ncbi:M20/M25/M40 family metallo-hydrolase [Marinactinospora thermotolerans]|uniref:PA domain-containing protein n=1 Tax=Marinactinospora thermotolerans DSM 45154 TaxID=1122192 RepID=A0A1T4Q838_9ACTN|nr:PA domain-containing protein [Marinactinospora thermotolerans DSM 45154]
MRTPTGRSPRPVSRARRRAATGVAVIAAFALGMAPAAHSAHAAGGELPHLVKTGAIRAHMENLQTIADYNGGNRAHGTPGYDVAAKYVMDQLKRAGYKPVKNTYEFDRWVENSPSVLAQTAPEAREFVNDEDFRTMSYSGAGDVTAPAVPVAADSSASGCSADDFAGFPAGAIAVVKRGTCAFSEKTANAAAAGAVGVVVFNHGATSDPADTGPINGTVSTLSEIPVVGTTPEVGAALVAAGEGLEVHLKVDSEVRTESSYNIIAETKGGAKDNVVVVGAHLDSVPEGAGINDNASGVAAILEVAKQLPKLGTPENKVRFAFWGTEEEGLIGSTEYVEGLSQAERDKIALYLNFDMIGSPNFGRFVYDGRGELEGSTTPPSGSGAIQKMFEDYFSGRGLVSEPTEFSGRSDYQAFMLAGIPSGGLFSGGDSIKTEEQVEYYGGTAGEFFDANYHTPADDITNINWDSVDQFSDAIAHSVETYSESTLPVNGVLRTMRAQEAPTFDRSADLWLR